MAVSIVGICNSAIIECGGDRISSITQDTKAAVLCNAVFTDLRDEVLRAHPWNFAVKRAVLAPNGTTPEYEYTYQYDWPNDCLRPLDMRNDSIDWVSEGRKILTNEQSINLRYIFKQEDPSEWDSMFSEAFALRLGAKIAYALTGSLSLSQELFKRYTSFLSFARSMDGAEGIMRSLVADKWTQARK